jgi:isoleucyl-tRNA synthetase
MRISNEIISRLIDAYRKIRNTCRFLLGNISDLDASMTGPGNINKDELSEIDRLALSLLQGLVKKVSNSYETFAFYEVYHAVYQFCIMDMSSFYLDILKDRLYTSKKDSKERRAAQTVLHNILISLTKMIAPILSFTAEEIWRHIPGVKEESVFLSDFPKVDPEFVDDGLEKKWELLWKIRNEVNKALEIKRQGKYIGNALEAKVTLYVDEATNEVLEAHRSFLPTLFIVSDAKVKSISQAPETAYKCTEINNVLVTVERAEGEKCLRCWNWSVSVGMHDTHPSLCQRCFEVLTA